MWTQTAIKNITQSLITFERAGMDLTLKRTRENFINFLSPTGWLNHWGGSNGCGKTG